MAAARVGRDYLAAWGEWDWPSRALAIGLACAAVLGSYNIIAGILR